MSGLDNIIFKRETLVKQPLTVAKDTIHIAFGIDENFVMGMGVLMYSILLHNPGKKLVFHVFTDNIVEADQNRLCELCESFPQTVIKTYYLAKDRLASLPTGFTWTTAIYYRFIIAEELYQQTDRVLYLDSDILCLHDFDLFMADDYTIGAVQDGEVPAERLRQLFTDEMASYFSSGVLYIDIKQWREHDITQKAMQLLQADKGIYQFYDQDVLNQLLRGKVDFWPAKYNYIYNLVFMKQNIPEDTVFLHYAGSAKPWQQWSQGHPATDLYLNYKAKSPWAEVPVQQPRTYKQAKFMARACKRKGNLIAAIYWYKKYISWRVLGRK